MNEPQQAIFCNTPWYLFVTEILFYVLEPRSVVPATALGTKNATIEFICENQIHKKKIIIQNVRWQKTGDANRAQPYYISPSYFGPII